MALDLRKLRRSPLRSKQITVRTFPSYSKWMSDNNISPSILFNQAIEQLMKEEK